MTGDETNKALGEDGQSAAGAESAAPAAESAAGVAGDVPTGEVNGETVSFPEVHQAVIDAIKTCYDPEIPVDIWELGLIYKIDVQAGGVVDIDMTLTSPACPVAGSLPGDVETVVRRLEGVSDVRLELVWDPPWSPERMSEIARYELNMF